MDKEKKKSGPSETLRGIDREEYVPLAGKYVSPENKAREVRQKAADEKYQKMLEN